MRLIILVAALLFPAVATAAPFCVVDNYGNEDCGFYSMDACRDNARYSRGACVYRPENKSTKGGSNPWDFGGAIMRGMERGEARRREQELHDLEVQRRQAEIAALQAQVAPPPAYEYVPASSGAPVPYSEDKSTLFYQCHALALYAHQMKIGGHKDVYPSARGEFEACRSEYEKRYPGDRRLRN